MKPNRKRHEDRPSRASEGADALPGLEGLSEYLSLALAPPGKDLLERYFSVCAGRSGGDMLTEVEWRWASVNLDLNPRWQTHWRELEARLGQRVEPRSSDRLRPDDSSTL